MVSGIRLITVPDFELFSFVVQVPVMGHPRFGLPLEESVVQLLVVDVDLSQLWPHLSKKINLRIRIFNYLILLHKHIIICYYKLNNTGVL